MATDDKFKKIKRRVGLKHYAMFKMFSIVLERATSDGGWFRQSDNVAHDEESLYVVFEEMVLDYDNEIIDLFLQEMITERLLTKDVLGFYYVTNWEEYQHAALSTPRVQEHRENKQLEADVTDVIQELNRVTGKTFRATTDAHRKHIRGRFRDGYTKSDMYAVIQHKQADWSNDVKLKKYVTPETLFRPGNFDRYLQEIPKENRAAIATGKLLKVENIHGIVSNITEAQYKKAEPGFYNIVK